MMRTLLLALFIVGCSSYTPQQERDALAQAAERYRSIRSLSGVVEEASISGESAMAIQRTFVAQKPDRLAVLIVRDGEPIERIICKDGEITRVVFEQKTAFVGKGTVRDIAFAVPSLKFFFEPNALSGELAKRLKLIGHEDTEFGRAAQYESVIEQNLPTGKRTVQAGLFVSEKLNLVVGGYEKSVEATGRERTLTWRMATIGIDGGADLSLFDYKIPEDYKIQRNDG
ncbi:MAG: hypothetical protein C4341_07285 [Armatimonadota bacterium]